jgi:lipid-binding SYLF domain-containing protein
LELIMPMSFTLFRSLFAGFFTAFCLFTLPAAADEYDEARIGFKSAEATTPFFESAYGYALFPTIGKGGIGIGGSYGKGRVYVGGKQVGTTSMSQLTVGLQLGGQAFSQIIFFEDEYAFKQFTSENFEFGAQATAVALTASASAQATTGGGATASAGIEAAEAKQAQAGYRKGMAIFTVAKGGLMYEASIGGQRFNYKPL